jgi:cytoskeleton protein RodZ
MPHNFTWGGVSCRSLSSKSPIPYDPASRQSRIPFAIHRKRETNLPSFGEKLKKEREKRKITLEEISASTKIGARMLQALEEDKFNQLPGGIFNKGFVRAYARSVGMDEDQTVADYLQASGDAPPPRAETVSHEDGAHAHGVHDKRENVAQLEASAGAPSRQLPWGLFAAVLLVVALALSLWSYRHREHPVPSAPATPIEQEAKPSTDTTGGSPQNPGESAVSSSSPPSAAPAAHHASVSPPIAPVKSPNATLSPALNPGEFSIAIQAREDSWISVTAAGKTSSELLTAGSDRTLRGRDQIIVKVGNAGGVDLRFNGKKLDIGGQYGDVKTLTFGPRGMVSNTPNTPTTP